MPTPEYVLALREHIGHDLLWLPGVTAVVLDSAHENIIVVRRADNGHWTPVTGIVDPGEEPADAAVREVAEEAGIEARPLHLAGLETEPPMQFTNGDRCQFLNMTFLLEHVSGRPHPADGENTEARWAPPDDLPPMGPRHRRRIEQALREDPRTVFRHSGPATSL